MRRRPERATAQDVLRQARPLPACPRRTGKGTVVVATGEKAGPPVEGCAGGHQGHLAEDRRRMGARSGCSKRDAEGSAPRPSTST